MNKLSEKEISRYSIALRDFEKAKEYILAARDHSCSSIEYEALVFSAIVSYFRPFSQNEKSNSAEAIAKLDIGNFGTLTEHQKILHEKYKKLRNKTLAHSEFELNPTNLNRETRVFSSSPFSLLNQDIDTDLFEVMLTQFIEICHNIRANYSLHE